MHLSVPGWGFIQAMSLNSTEQFFFFSWKLPEYLMDMTDAISGVCIRARRFLFVFLVQRTHWFQPLARKKQTKNIQRKCVLLDKFAWTSTVLNSRREIDILLDANNSIMETDGEGKFVSFKVVLGSTSLFKMPTAGPAGLDCLVCRFYWSTGAAEGLIMKDSGTHLRGEVPKKVFFVCDSCCGQNVDLDREGGAGGLTIARSLSCACSFAMLVSARSLPREREIGRAIWKKRQKRSAQVDVLCLFVFSLHCKTLAC